MKNAPCLTFSAMRDRRNSAVPLNTWSGNRWTGMRSSAKKVRNESAGKQVSLTFSKKWLSAVISKQQINYLLKNDKGYAHDWDETYKDKLIKLVFIGQNLNEKAIRKELDQI